MPKCHLCGLLYFEVDVVSQTPSSDSCQVIKTKRVKHDPFDV